MVQVFLEKLCFELSITPVPKLDNHQIFFLTFAPGIEIAFADLHPGVAMRASIAACPTTRKEDLFIYLMRANLLGQGTGDARIGLDQDEKTLTLSLGLPYEMIYSTFREAFEEFVNHLVFWKDTVAKFENEKTIY